MFHLEPTPFSLNTFNLFMEVPCRVEPTCVLSNIQMDIFQHFWTYFARITHKCMRSNEEVHIQRYNYLIKRKASPSKL